MNLPKLKKSVIFTSIVLSSTFISQLSHAGPGREVFEQTGEQYLSTPGTRAMGMGGAYVAFASDSSAIWYNAAGLVGTEGFSDLTLEYGDFVTATPGVEIDENDVTTHLDSTYETERDIKYLAWSNNGFGLAYFQPYSYKLYLRAEGDVDENEELQEFSTTYREFKIATSGRLTESLSWGIGLDLIQQTIDCDYGCFDEWDDTSEDTAGFGFSFGVQGDWTFQEESENPINLKLGANYRSAAQMDELILLDIEQDIMPTRPQSISYGASGNVPFSIGETGFSLSVSLHLETIEHNRLDIPYYFLEEDSFENDYSATPDFYYGSTAPEEDRTAYGLELQTILSQDVDLYLRVGMSDTTATNANYTPSSLEENAEFDLTDSDFINNYGSDTSSMTFGIGLRINNWIIDLASENRTIDDNTFDGDYENEDGTFGAFTPFSQDVKMTSVSISYTF